MSAVEQLVVGVLSGLILSVMLAMGWYVRRTVASYDRLTLEVAGMRTDLAISRVTGPDTIRRVGALEIDSASNTNAIAVLRVQLDQHERWHERTPRMHGAE